VSELRVVYEDPLFPDEPCRVLIPDPNWMASAVAMLGTVEDAIERLIMKDVPPRVWRDYVGNRQILKIVPASAIPSDRRFRNAWRLL